MAPVVAAVFDAYGTLLDVHSAMARHAPALGEAWQGMSQEWRVKQLEYSWVRSLAGRHRDFAELTDAALDFVAARHCIAPAIRDELRDAYRALDAYPEVPAMLAALRDRGVQRAILSNGSPAMLAQSVAAAGIGDLLDDVLSVEAAGVFKPDMRVYALATSRFGCAPGQIAFMSSNAWDAFGALTAGFRVFWVNRQGQPDEYGLRGRVTELSGLQDLPGLLAGAAA